MFFEGKVPRSNDLDQGKVPIIFIFLEERFLGQMTWTKERFLIFYFFSRKGSSIRWFGERKGSFVGEHKYKKTYFHNFSTLKFPRVVYARSEHAQIITFAYISMTF
tara:strand:+ start:148 stop:465 length:318 start_codon:yes stop_codon:yes gene_type:complete